MYIYDWSYDPPYTDDPAQAGTFGYGKDQHVYLNGKEVLGDTVRSARTGEDGYVEVALRNAAGEFYILSGEVATEILHGKVEYKHD